MKKTIEERVDRIEKIFWVVAVVAVIFGLSGGWGYSILRDAETRVDDLSNDMGNVQADIKETITEEENKALDRINNEAVERLAFVPTGAVIAFNLQSCPGGWKEAEFAKGRFLIGVGESSDLTRHYLEEIGGAETHTLTIEKMPKHTHTVNTTVTGNSFIQTTRKWKGGGEATGESWVGKSGNISIGVTVESAGDSEPYKIMPPYVALLFCEKE